MEDHINEYPAEGASSGGARDGAADGARDGAAGSAPDSARGSARDGARAWDSTSDSARDSARDSAPDSARDSENLLDEIVGDQVELTLAGSGQRFANHLIDYVLFYLLWRVLLAFIAYPLAHVLVFIGYSRVGLFIGIYLMAVIFEIGLMTGLEYFARGKTPGKLATRTRAVNADGTRLTARTAFLRSLCRAIPFDAFSALGSPCYPWHDKLSKTYVIDDRTSRLPAIED